MRRKISILSIISIISLIVMILAMLTACKSDDEKTTPDPISEQTDAGDPEAQSS